VVGWFLASLVHFVAASGGPSEVGAAAGAGEVGRWGSYPSDGFFFASDAGGESGKVRLTGLEHTFLKPSDKLFVRLRQAEKDLSDGRMCIGFATG
jgi:hypothetical protein